LAQLLVSKLTPLTSHAISAQPAHLHADRHDRRLRFSEGRDAKFGDQHFKTAIALIELRRVRNGSDPDTLKDLQFTAGGVSWP
jgi:hypothetical protein